MGWIWATSLCLLTLVYRVKKYEQQRRKNSQPLTGGKTKYQRTTSLPSLGEAPSTELQLPSPWEDPCHPNPLESLSPASDEICQTCRKWSRWLAPSCLPGPGQESHRATPTWWQPRFCLCELRAGAEEEACCLGSSSQQRSLRMALGRVLPPGPKAHTQGNSGTWLRQLVLIDAFDKQWHTYTMEIQFVQMMWNIKSFLTHPRSFSKKSTGKTVFSASFQKRICKDRRVCV